MQGQLFLADPCASQTTKDDENPHFFQKASDNEPCTGDLLHFFQVGRSEILPNPPNPPPPLKDSVATEKPDSPSIPPAEFKRCTIVLPCGGKVNEGKPHR